MSAGCVGIVFVSHSAKIAEGLVDLAAQMAPSPSLQAAGGTDEDALGTSFSRVSTAILAADAGRGVVVLCDLGSAILTAETAWDFLDSAMQERVRIVDAPLVEGGVAAAVAAEIGGNLDAVVDAAEAARSAGATANANGPAGSQHESDRSDGITRTVTLINAEGLHARPAADFVKLASTFAAEITVNGQDGTSLLGIMGLGLTVGSSVLITATGAEAEAATTALASLIESGFGE